MLCRGKLPARQGAVQLRFSSFLDTAKLPPLPPVFGHSRVIPDNAWGMLGNNLEANCVQAGAAHETMLWTAQSAKPAQFSIAGLNADYLAVNPGDTTFSNGTDVQVYAEYRQKTGIIDANGNRHKIAAYLALDPGNIDHLFYATYLFGAVGIGWALPDIAEQQFTVGTPWDFSGAIPGGGHYTPFVGRRPGIIHVITWGQRFPVLESSLTTKYCDEAIVYVSQEALINQKSPEGFNYEQLNAYLAAL